MSKDWKSFRLQGLKEGWYSYYTLLRDWYKTSSGGGLLVSQARTKASSWFPPSRSWPNTDPDFLAEISRAGRDRTGGLPEFMSSDDDEERVAFEAVDPSRFKAKSCPYDEVVDWVGNTLSTPNIQPEDCPSPAAWALREHTLRSPEALRQFWSIHWPRAKKADDTTEDRERDRAIEELVDRLTEVFAPCADVSPAEEGLLVCDGSEGPVPQPVGAAESDPVRRFE